MSDRLMQMLGNARAVMNKVESGNYETGHVNPEFLATNGENLVEHVAMPYDNMGNVNNVAPKMMNGQPVYRNLETSKLPQNIKEAMLSQPIPQAMGPNHTFTLDDVNELIDKPRQIHQPRRAPIQEHVKHSDTFTVSESALIRIVEDIVEQKINNFMTETYNKNLTEQTIKRTINTLIKEGKITTKKKVNS